MKCDKKSTEKTKEQTKQLRNLNYIVKPLLIWFDANKRSLPWREEVSPYRVWVSEIMLQQTRVEAVKPYFERFITELPDIEALAKAKEERLLKLWEGLGYYNRVRNMQKAAVQIMEEYGGNMPSDYDKLLQLKGIGSYTAGAIASIAFQKKVPAVDGNVLRVLSRLTMDGDDIADTKVKKRVEKELEQIMPERAGDFNQALMELGAIVCLPNGEPKCAECPWREFCQAFLEERIEEFPYKSALKKRNIERKTVLIIRDGKKLLLHKRPRTGLLAGMYEFPMMEGWHNSDSIIQYVRSLGCEPLRVEPVREAKHIFTHKEWHMKGYIVRTQAFDYGGGYVPQEGYFLAEPEKIKEEYPIPSAFGAYTPYADVKLTQEYIRE